MTVAYFNRYLSESIDLFPTEYDAAPAEYLRRLA